MRPPDRRHVPSRTSRPPTRIPRSAPSTSSNETGGGAVTGGHDVVLDLDDIQSGALHERPSPYVGKYLLLRINDRAAGRELVRRLLTVIDHGHPSSDPNNDAWITAAF